MLNAWTIWWNADRLTHGLSGYWDAPIFHPVTGTFAFSEPQPATWIVAPIVWLTGSPVPAYQVYLVGTLVLNGLFTVRLLRTLRVRWSVATAGGIAVLLLPLVHQNLEAAQLTALWGVLWTLDAIIRHRNNPSWHRGVVLGIAFASVFMTCIHHGVFLTLLLILTAWMTIPFGQWRTWLAGAAVAVAVASLLLLPLLLPMRRILKEHAFARRASRVQSLSATIPDWTQAVPGTWTELNLVSERSSRPLSPGWGRISLALIGVVLVARGRRHQRAVLFLTAFGFWAFLWSFGMNLQIAGWHPWATLAAWGPGFSQVRSAYRFAYYAQLAVVLLATVGLDRLFRSSAAVASKGYGRRLWIGLLVVAWGLVAFETPLVLGRPARVPNVSREPEWAAFVREHTTRGRAIACLPFATDRSATGLEPTGQWMLYQTCHHVPMVNGYSGFFPEPWYRFLEAFTDEPYSESTFDKLVAAGVEYLVIDPTFLAANKAPPASSGRYRLIPAFRDESGTEVWRIAW